MPRTLIVTASRIDLEYEAVEEKLDKAKGWMRYAPGCWLVYTELSADEWYRRMAAVLDVEGNLVLIAEVDLSQRSGRLSPAAWKWIKKVERQSTAIAS